MSQICIVLFCSINIILLFYDIFYCLHSSVFPVKSYGEENSQMTNASLVVGNIIMICTYTIFHEC
jgi:hypothetical protein